MKIYGDLEGKDLIQEGDEYFTSFDAEYYWKPVDKEFFGKTSDQFFDENNFHNDYWVVRRKLFDNVNEMMKFIFLVYK